MSNSVKFKASLETEDGMTVLFKSDDGSMMIWGPASVEMVDKENDRVTTDALKSALPQLLRRSALSFEHTDQIVGEIKEKFELDEPKDIKIDGEAYERSAFPTDVLKSDEDDVPHDGLYVAAEVWSDTEQAREAQKGIENGDIDSYSISGEAISSSTRVKDGSIVDDIKEMDLSAVTLCEEGMNQKAKFAVIKGDEPRDTLKTAVRKAVETKMPDDNENEDGEGGVGEDEETADNVSEGMTEKQVKSAFSDVLKEELPDGDLATKDDIPDDDDLREKFEEWSSGDEEQEEKEVDPDEIEDPDDDGEEEVDIGGDDEEMPPEEDDEEDEMKSFDDLGEKAQSAAYELAAHTNKTADEIMDIVAQKEEDDLPMDDDDDEEVEEDPEEDDDEEMEMDDESGSMVEPGHSVNLETLKDELPDDLYASVADHLSDPDEGGVEMEETEDAEEETEPADDKSKGSDGPSEDDVAKAASSTGGYLEEVAGSSVEFGDDEQFEKSFEHEDVAEPDPEEGSQALNAFYDNVEN